MDLEGPIGGETRLAPHHSAFRVPERLLLTGHSHQAWPDRAERGQRRAFVDAAERLLDVDHQLNVVPFSLDASGLGDVFVVDGGHKARQLVEVVPALRRSG